MIHRTLRSAAAVVAAMLGVAGTASAALVVNEVKTLPNSEEFVEVLVTTTGNYQNYVIMDGLAAGAIGGGGI